MKDYSVIKLPQSAIESESPTPVQFLPSAELYWRAPVIFRKKPVELRPEPAQQVCSAAR